MSKDSHHLITEDLFKLYIFARRFNKMFLLHL